MNYNEFLERKRHTSIDYGIEAKWIPEQMFDFQKHIVEKSIKKGRYANFIDTGLGKTIMQLVHAVNYAKHTNKPVLIITPLAVAFQFIKEAEKFQIDDISYSKDGNFKTKIVICNYERLHFFNANDFDCVILDESSILKNFDGAIKSQVTAFLKKVKYRFLFTATPSPNDFVELGTSSEALGYLGYMDMLSKFFANNENNIRPQDIGSKWYLKPHAQERFFEWVASWSLSIKNPSDIGFDNSAYQLPNLILNKHSVKNRNNMVINNQILMFNLVAQRLGEVREEQKQTIQERCEVAYDLANNYDTSVYWCNFNDEGNLLNELDKNAYQIKGSMDLDKKEEILKNFFDGNIKKLITKPKMTAFGLNWQHCNHTVYFPTFSYEQYYQSIRRFWRFGQQNDVIVDMVYSDGQKRVIDTLELKTQKAIELFQKLNKATNKDFESHIEKFDKKIQLPTFLQG